MISPDIGVRDEMNVDVEIKDCQCGEPALSFTGNFVSWERCESCSHRRLLAWTSCQTSTLVLGELSPDAGYRWRSSLHA